MYEGITFETKLAVEIRSVRNRVIELRDGFPRNRGEE